jgi:nitrate reductase gamma subunit
MVFISDVDSFTFLSLLWVVVGWKVFCSFVVGAWWMRVGKKYFWTPRVVEMKLKRLGVVEVERKISSTTTAVKSQALLTHEETLKILAYPISVSYLFIFRCYDSFQSSKLENVKKG